MVTFARISWLRQRCQRISLPSTFLTWSWRRNRIRTINHCRISRCTPGRSMRIWQSKIETIFRQAFPPLTVVHRQLRVSADCRRAAILRELFRNSVSITENWYGRCPWFRLQRDGGELRHLAIRLNSFISTVYSTRNRIGAWLLSVSQRC